MTSKARFMEKKLEWAQKPGFWDPFVVTQQCVPILSGKVHPNLKWPKCDVEVSKPTPLEACEGIKIYLKPLPDHPEIDEAVDQYIKFPCKDVLKKYTQNSLENALYFLIAYLRKRGPFIRWKITEVPGSIFTRRFISKWSSTYLNGLAELDYCAATMIGRYLNYLISVGYAHNLFYLKEILAKLYGPLFIKMTAIPELQHKITPETAVQLPVTIFTAMLEGIPWGSYMPFENMTLTVQPSNKMELTHKWNELSDFIEEKTTIPQNEQNNLGEQNVLKLMAEGVYEDAKLDHHQMKELMENPFKVDKGKVFPPDKCKINPGSYGDIMFRY